MADLPPAEGIDGDGNPQTPVTGREVMKAQFPVYRLRPGYDETEVDDFLDRITATLRFYEENDPWAIARAAVQGEETAAAEYEAMIAGLRAELAKTKRAAKADVRR